MKGPKASEASNKSRSVVEQSVGLQTLSPSCPSYTVQLGGASSRAPDLVILLSFFCPLCFPPFVLFCSSFCPPHVLHFSSGTRESCVLLVLSAALQPRCVLPFFLCSPNTFVASSNFSGPCPGLAWTLSMLVHVCVSCLAAPCRVVGPFITALSRPDPLLGHVLSLNPPPCPGTCSCGYECNNDAAFHIVSGRVYTCDLGNQEQWFSNVYMPFPMQALPPTLEFKELTQNHAETVWGLCRQNL